MRRRMVDAVGGTVLVLGGFVVYATWAATQGEHHEHGSCLPPLQGTGPHAGPASTARDARHSEGNYQSDIEDLKRRTGADADQPHRIGYKKLMRA